MRPIGLVFTTGAVALAFACLPRKSSPAPTTSPAAPQSTGAGDIIGFGGKPTKLAAEEESIYAQAGACVLLSVSVMDAEDFYVYAEKETTVNLAATPANVGFFSDPACSTAAKSFALAKGESGGGTFASAPSSGSTKITLSDAAQGGLQPTSSTINTAVVTQLGSRGAGIPLIIDECAPQSVLAQDDEGHPVILGKEATITATTSSTSGKFYADDECTKESNTFKLRAGESESESIFYKDTSAGAPSLTFSSSTNTSWKKAAISVTVSKDTYVTP
jgi:hypothetical protein